MIAQQEILQGILVQQIMNVQAAIEDREIEPVVARTQAIIGPACAMKSSERLPGMGQIGGLDVTKRLNYSQLLQFVQLVKLLQSLIGKSNLVHALSG